MHSLIKPTKDFKDLFISCVSEKNLVTKINLTNKSLVIFSSADEYEENMIAKSAHLLSPLSITSLAPVTKLELETLYAYQMVKKKAAGRDYYDELLINSKSAGCCFCTYEDPTEVDHFLPKTDYPEFSILPINLLPVCHRCNKAKSRYFSDIADQCLIHPYFENYDDKSWLEATLTFENNIPFLNYKIADNMYEKSSNLKKRMEFQFKKLNLNERYSIQAAREISAKSNRYKKAFSILGQIGLKSYLLEEANSFALYNKNSWISQLYNCLADSDRFCSMYWTT